MPSYVPFLKISIEPEASSYRLKAFMKVFCQVKMMETYCNGGMTDLTPVINAYEDALLARWPFTRYQPMDAFWAIRYFIFTHFPAIIAD